MPINDRRLVDVTRLLVVWPFSLWCSYVFLSSVFAQANLQYQNRGNRYEGVKPAPVSGYEVELISAQAENKNSEQLSDRARISFYLDQPGDVHVVVRERDYKTYYWMDRLQPSPAWRGGVRNVFEWPTGVIASTGLRLSDLGVVVRLNRPEPSLVESVAPALLDRSARQSGSTRICSHSRPTETSGSRAPSTATAVTRS